MGRVLDHEKVSVSVSFRLSVSPMVEFRLHRCDKIDLETGEIKPLEARPTYGTAQKMRAAISHQFGREYDRGNQPWSENPLKPGTFMGNPSLSSVVSQYMVSLRRTKVGFTTCGSSQLISNNSVLRFGTAKW